jgi:hypothetical protein
LNNIFCLIDAIIIQAWHLKNKTLHYLAKLYVIQKRKFPKLKSEKQVSFVNEAQGGPKPNVGLVLPTKIP